VTTLDDAADRGEDGHNRDIMSLWYDDVAGAFDNGSGGTFDTVDGPGSYDTEDAEEAEAMDETQSSAATLSALGALGSYMMRVTQGRNDTVEPVGEMHGKWGDGTLVLGDDEDDGEVLSQSSASSPSSSARRGLTRGKRGPASRLRSVVASGGGCRNHETWLENPTFQLACPAGTNNAGDGSGRTLTITLLTKFAVDTDNDVDTAEDIPVRERQRQRPAAGVYILAGSEEAANECGGRWVVATSPFSRSPVSVWEVPALPPANAPWVLLVCTYEPKIRGEFSLHVSVST
jgi:hypothetical protein